MKNMGLTPASLRTWILGLAGLLVAAIAAFFIYGRWQGRGLRHDLPAGLGSSIQQSTNGFTYSESRGPHTVFTLHASKAVQYKKDGHAELHDVSITLYGAQGSPANRIYGSAFDWDPVHGIARAMGEVQIDFQAVTGSGDQAGAASSDEDQSRNTVHVKTSDLVFNKQTGLASTPERIEFRLAEAAGSATGASFDQQTGVIILAADVAFNSSIEGSPLTVRARHAQYDRASRLLYLLEDVADYSDTHSSSDQATVSFRADGSAYHVKAQGHVVASGGDGQRLDGNLANIDLGPKSEPQQAVLDQGLLYVGENAARVLHGSATSAVLQFGPQTTLRHAQLNNAVSVVDQEKLPLVDPVQVKQNRPVSTTREVQASKVDIDFVSGPGPDQSPQAQHILAAGAARLNVHTIYAKTPPEDTSIGGDQLLATLTDGDVLSSLRGTGHTSLVSTSPSGVTQSSTGDNLQLTFSPPPERTGAKAEKSKTPAAQPAAQLESAVQLGNVTVVQQGAPGPGDGPAETTRATAQRATYDGATQVMQLTGSPRIQEASGEVAAAQIDLQRATGNADATGGVKATYRQSNGQPGVAFAQSGPVHVVADHAHSDHATNLTTFFGKAGEPARLWQASDAVSAPVLELSQKQGTLFAHGPGSPAKEGPAVNAVFVSTARPSPNAKPAAGPSVVRVQSRTLLYADSDHKAVFSGAVVAETSTGLVHSSFMDVYFSASPPAAGNQQISQTQKSAQSVSKIVARGGVEVRQPSRKGTGEELIYTAADGKFVLTGTGTAPPHLSDEVRGSVTGNALIFNERDDSVVVSGGSSPVVTQTHIAK
ncbi:MAG: LptA/OstA family protein [Acidobacteriaceae bacterium]